MRAVCLLLLAVALAGCGGSSNNRPRDGDRDGVADGQDCEPTDPGRWQLLAFQSVDGDSDGFRINSSGQLCAGSSLPATHSVSSVAPGDVDCDDNAASRWQMMSYVSRDADADGFSVGSSGQVCSGTALPAGYGTTVPSLVAADCDDSSASAWRIMMTYVDADGDGVGAGAGAIVCVGTSAPSGRSLLGYDPLDDPGDPAAGAVSNLELSSWLLTTP